MAKILLIDFTDADYRYLLDRKFEVDFRESSCKTGKTQSLEPPRDCRVVLYQADCGDSGSGPHAGDAERFEKIVAQGGAIVCFVGNCQESDLTGLVGSIPHLRFQENKLPDKIYEIKDGPFSPIFTEFRPFISRAIELFPMHNGLGTTVDLAAWDPPSEAKVEVLAESFKNYPVAALLRRGEGFYLLLPWFGEKNVEVAELLLGHVLPEVSPRLFEPDGVSWLDSYDYIFPGLLDVYKQMEEENERHRQNIALLEERAAELKATEQASFNKLLTGEGKELQEAVIRALRYLNWTQVIDVDEYWKRVIRIKEEDVWLMEEDDRSIGEMIRDRPITMVAIRSGDGGAADDDCLLLQRYKGRRMQEFNNTRMKAVLIGNYFLGTEAKLREVPFSESQVNEATKDGNGLLTTYELFKTIKAEKEKKTTKEAIREQLRNKTGLVTFEY
jgi:hypothetical protein